jgi:hypothetical protein
VPPWCKIRELLCKRNLNYPKLKHFYSSSRFLPQGWQAVCKP